MASTAPIILVGTHRSGTTWMGQVFSRHPGLAYWSEPRHVWTWGNRSTPDDVLTAEHATERVKRHIRRTFAEYIRRHDGERLCEKTPSNCLRLPFVRAVYPEAKIVMLIRDGRAVIPSAERMMRAGPSRKRIMERALETKPWEWPRYIPQLADAVVRKALRRPLRFWGPRPPGWREWMEHDDRDVMLAKQWAGSIGRAVQDGRAMEPSLYLEVKYEDLMDRPREVMGRVVQFAQIEKGGSIVEYAASTADPSRQSAWREALDVERLARIRPHMEPMLTMLGYEW